MTPRQFFDRVAQLRKFQKEYFKTRDHTALQQAQALEKEIDAEIVRVKSVLACKGLQQPEETPDPKQCHYYGREDSCYRQLWGEGRKCYIPYCRIAKYNQKQCSHFITGEEYQRKHPPSPLLKKLRQNQ